jgi:hypothetical protein
VASSTGSGVAAKDTGLKLALIGLRTSGRLLSGQVGDAMLKRIAMKQQEAYYNALTDVLLNSPNASKTVEDAYNYIDLVKYGTRQAGTRGGSEVIDMISTPGVQEYQPTEGGEQRIREQLDGIEQNNQSSIDISPDTPLFDELPDTDPAPALGQFDPALSPTIVPLDKDREIAMRNRGNLGGIASLA